MLETLSEPPLPHGDETETCHPMFRAAPSSVSFNKLRKRLLRNTRQAIDDFSMVQQGRRQRWLVGLSGGKDSYGLLALLEPSALVGHARFVLRQAASTLVPELTP